MSNEIAAYVKLDVNNGFLRYTQTARGRFNMTGTDYHYETQTFTATASTIDVSLNLTEFGWSYFKNTSTTQTLEIGFYENATYGGEWQPFIILKPSEFFLGPLATTTLAARCSTGGSAALEILVYER